MIDTGFLVIVGAFLIYYFLILFLEKRLLRDPKDIIEKILSIILLYAGISIIFYALTGVHFLSNTDESYAIYLFIIGFIAIIWTVPTLLQEFSFFRKFLGIEKAMWEREKEELLMLRGLIPPKHVRERRRK